MASRGTLEPVTKQDLFAPHDAVVRTVHVEYGSAVDRGTLLLELESTELTVQLAQNNGQLRELDEEISALERARSDRLARPEEVSRYSAQISQKRALHDNLARQGELLRQKKQQQMIESPLQGAVVTWQVRDRLVNRPVQRGQTLLTVADLNGPWELELYVPENHMGFVGSAQREFGEELRVSFVLAAQPGTTHYGKIRSVHTTAGLHGEDDNTILVRVEIDSSEIPPEALRAGSTVMAQVQCGRSSLAYRWFHDAVGWIQRTWFKL